MYLKTMYKLSTAELLNLHTSLYVNICIFLNIFLMFIFHRGRERERECERERERERERE